MSDHDRDEMSRFHDLLRSLGFIYVPNGSHWRHKDFRFTFDFSGTKRADLLTRLWQIFSTKGYENCKRDIRHLIGIEE